MTRSAGIAGDVEEFVLGEDWYLLTVHILQCLDELPCDLLCSQAVQPMRLHLEALQNGLLDILHDNACAALVLEGVQQLEDANLPFHCLVHLSGRTPSCKLSSE